MKTTPVSSSPRWDLESIFPGGSSSAEFAAFCRQIKSEISEAEGSLAALPTTLADSDLASWTSFIQQLQKLAEHLHHAVAFAHCLVSQDATDSEAQKIEADIHADIAGYGNLFTALEARAVQQKDDRWEALLAGSDLKAIRFYLDEKRTIAREKLSVEQESLANDLAVDGYHAWNRLYEKISGDLRVDFTDENGKTENLSFGQLANKLSQPNRATRKQAYEKMNQMWQPVTELAAMALNSQAGFRLALYKRRGWDSPLKEPLIMSRIKEESLNAMWSVVARNVPRLKPFLQAKKQQLKIDRLMWYDQTAPVAASEERLTFAAAAEFIIDNLRTFSPEMADFSRMALDNHWIEAEDRSGKRAGGYCTGFGDLRESRIFMTFSESYHGLRVLAHELGHAYHSYTLRDKDYYATRYTLSVAEGASTFNELLVADAALAAAEDDNTRLMLLDQKLTNAFVFMCNIRARFLFDSAFYERRKTGVVGKDDLCALMLEAQKQAYGDLLDPEGFHDLFWATKLHFFLTDVPFYNFPYTFGYLFSNGIYARAKSEGAAFAAGYRDLLRDTGSMQTEDLAQKHLGLDLAGEQFWQSALDRILSDVEQFTALVK